MGILDTVVVGVDGSTASTIAATWAADRVPATGSLHLVHARGPGGSANDRFPVPADLASGLPGRVTETSVDDDPAPALLAVADRVGADAIVVGPHSAPHNLGILGRVTRRLLQRASCPLVVAKPDPPASPAGDGGRWPVVACVGYGDATEQAAGWAAAYAEARDRSLTLLHVVGYRPIFPADSPSDMLASYLGGDILRTWAREDLEEIRGRLQQGHGTLTIETAVDTGFASRAITEASDEAELMVLGKRQNTAALRNFISPRVHKPIARSSCSVAVVPLCSAET